jgi:TPR repeat protein
MNRLLILPVLLLTLLVGTPASSADWEKGWTAYDSGDYATALREWTPPAEQGDAAAQYKLGVTYEKGTGVIQDNVYAHMWYNIAASSGKSKNAPKNRDIVAGKMTPSQLETAQNLARECVRRKYKGC